MKHRRGIDLLLPDKIGYMVGEGSRRSEPLSMYETLDRLPEWYVIVGWCPRCPGCRERSHNSARLRKLPR